MLLRMNDQATSVPRLVSQALLRNSVAAFSILSIQPIISPISGGGAT
jgi:hypothetical protein